MIPTLAASAVLGTQTGSAIGLWIGARARTRGLEVLLAVVLIVVATMMLVRGLA
jgi:uncharacterized membrane protein YfcA